METTSPKIRKNEIKIEDNTTDSNLDEELYSRQLYVIGHDAMMKMMSTKVLIIGIDGLGQEIAKNLCLAGIKSVSLFDKSLVTEASLLSGYYHKKAHLNQAKDISALSGLQLLNKYVKVNVVEETNIMDYQIVISVNQDFSYNLELGETCHKNNIKFIISNVSGLFSQIFCDFQTHTCIDKNGESISMGVINDIAEDGILTVADGSSHNLEDNDTVKLSHRSEMYQVKIINRTQFQLLNYSCDKIIVGGDFEQVKMPFLMEFKGLKESLENPEIMNFDFTNENKSKVLHDLFIKNYTDLEGFTELQKQFHDTKGSLIPPMCSIVGGFTAQEAIKGASGKFLPLKQFFYFESADAYAPDNETDNSNFRYSDMIRVFGKEGFDKIKATKIFLVGAGAIGCENLKNFVCSGLGSEGKIIVTDMDSIEKSNLNRQFLFKEDDVSKMKSESAIKHVSDLNEDFAHPINLPEDNVSECINDKIEAINLTNNGNLEFYTSAVGKDTEHIFTDKFFRDVDIISNALDNVEARAYMDERCIRSRKPLVDAGTLGTKGHVQVVIPFVSESYSSSVDPQEKTIPLCTIKSYPYSIEHTIEWALSEFSSHFNEDVNKLQEFLENKDNCEDQDLLEIFSKAPKNVECCLKNALSIFVNNFSTSVQNLLNSFPPDHQDADGNPFWAPPKKIPSPISFNINDPLHILFVESAANLFAASHNIRRITLEEVYAFLENILSLKEPNPIKFNDEDADFSHLCPLIYDKDSWHTDFIYSCANLRARNYSIKERSKHFIRGIAGKIIPAIATTTAIVSGLATLEIFKYIIRRDSRLDNSSTAENCLINSKNSFLDLAFPFLALTDLVKPKTLHYQCNNKKIKFTIWSRMEFPDCELGQIIEKIKDRIGVDVGMISIGSKVVYWNICNKYDKNLEKKVSELCNKKDGQLIVYIDVLADDDSDLVSMAVVFEE